MADDGTHNGTSLSTSDSIQLRPTLFDRISERRVTFCVDTSGSMYSCLEAVKEQLIDALCELAQRRGHDEDSMFNVIEFSTDVIQWADKMVRCTPETVAVATQWIKNLSPKTGTNTLAALTSAFRDSSCQAVYLITDSVPDTYPDDVIDAAVAAAGNRPVHALYIQGSVPDRAAVDFLRELAMETYGSFHVVTIAQHGAVERVTPIYRAEASAEKIVRTTDGNIYPTNHKTCSVVTSLNEQTLYTPQFLAHTAVPFLTSPVPAVYAASAPPYPYCMYPWPYRHYYYYAQPALSTVGWSRFRPAKAWLKHAHEFINGVMSLTLGAGVLLINVSILARRHADGFFYRGTTKNQILGNKFLVEFGPCKHGRFNDTEYQETYVYDIVSHVDALRHPVLVDDKVLAPWEPEGERYAPGVVIDGQEGRMAAGTVGPDKPLVVTFHDGKTVNVEKDKAVWIPHDLHERIAFELNLPKNVRKEFAERDRYPQITQSGYPSSGPIAFPLEFDRHPLPTWIPNGNAIALHPPMHGRSQAWDGQNTLEYYKRPGSREGSSVVKSSDMEKLIPGTDMTREELNKRVMSQITDNKALLNKNEGRREDRNGGIENELRKSVSFADHVSEHGVNKGHGDGLNGGHSDGDIGNFSDYSLSDYECEPTSEAEGVSRGRPRSKLLHKRGHQRSRSAGSWKYWKNEPSPSLHEPLHYGPYREGPFKGCMEMPSYLREGNKNWATVESLEWTSPMSRVVDTFSRNKYGTTVRDCMHIPQPPLYRPRPPTQGPGREVSTAVGEHQRPQEMIAEARKDFRQSKVLQREIDNQRRVADHERNQTNYMDHRRHLACNQLSKEQGRHMDYTTSEQRHIEAKRFNREQRTNRHEMKLNEAREKDERHLAAKIYQRENRVIAKADVKHDADIVAAQRYAMKELQSVARVEAQGARLIEADIKQSAYQAARQRSAAQHTAHFRRIEAESQKRKDLNNHVKDLSLAIYRSTVLP